MKTRDFLWGLLACAAFSACSSDEVVKNDNLEKSKSYMRVSFNIADDAASRNARGVTDGGFAVGTETNIITGNTIFLFYTASGDYVTSGTLVEPPTLEGNETVTGGDHSDQVNSKYDSEAVVVLDCTEVLKNNITQMLTVANIKETASLQNKVLADALDEIALVSDNSPSGIIIDGETGFLMSTSVFVEGDEIKNVTPIDPEDNFAESEEEAKSNEKAVEVYLERASAKVEVAKATEGYTSSVTEKVDGTEEVLEITIDGWTLNGTVKDTYIVKQMEESWITNAPFDNWNYALNHRSYWAKSTNWSNTSGKPDEDYVLDYKSWDEAGTSLDTPEYCFENTISGIPSVTDHNITTVLVKAHFGDGSTDYYEFAGDFYTTAEYKKLILAQLASAGYKKSPDGTTFVALESGDVMFDTNGLSGVKVAMLPSNTYAKDESFVETTDVNTYVNALPLITTVKGYKNGACRYQIPIEHLHSTVEHPAYGVVRNHWYKLTINKITKIGTAVYDPDVPNTDLDEEELTYYMAVKLHVLSWHMVIQDVTL